MEWCSIDPCETEAVCERNDKPYCFTCAEAYDRGYDDGYEDGLNDENG